jgi:hypothetical protein
MFPSKEVRGILGTTFSGSLNSLCQALVESHLFSIEIFSGTTTSEGAIEEFRQCPAKPRFDALRLNDRTSEDRLLKFLVELEGSNERAVRKSLVVLAEGDTAFGQQFRDAASKNTKVKHSKTNTSIEEVAEEVNVITYPREISRLRNAYQDEPDQTSKQLAATTGPRQLPLGLKDSGTGRDTVPTFSPQTPTSLETVLFQITDRLKSSQFDTVVLTGSNVLDTLFLSEFLRRNVPDIRVVVFDADLLFAHGSDSLDHLGTLATTAYPLLWQLAPTRPLDVFGSENEEAEFHAMQAILDPKEPYSGDDLWLTVIGRGAYWPVALLDDSDPQSPKDKALSKIVIPQPTRVWSAVFWSAALLCAVYIWAVTRALSGTVVRNLAIFHPQPEPDGPFMRGLTFYQLLCTLWLFAAFCTLSYAPIRLALAGLTPLKWPSESSFWNIQSIGGLLVLAFLLAVALASVAKWKSAKGRLAGIAVCIFTSALAWWAWQVSFEEIPRGVFRALRAVQLPSGVSPNVPLLLLFLAMMLWSWTNWRRSIFVSEREVHVPSLPLLPFGLAGRIRREFREPVFHGGIPGVIAALIIVACTIAAKRWITSIEGQFYDWIIVALIGIVSAALMSTAWGFFSVWTDLRYFLRVLHACPIIDLDAVTNAVEWPSFWASGGGNRSYHLFRRTVRAMESIQAADPKYSHLEPHLSNLKQHMVIATQKLANEEYIPASVMRGMNESSTAMADALIAYPPNVEESMKPLATQVITLRFVSFIRYVWIQLRNQLSFLTGGFLLTAASLNSYPFQGGGYLRWWTATLFLLLGILITVALWQMNKDAVLTKLDKKKTDGIDWDGWKRLASVGALPLLAGISALFPSVGQFLFSWINPALSTLK